MSRPTMFETEPLQDVANFLKARAHTGMLVLNSIEVEKEGLDYIDKCRVHHRPTGASVTLTRNDIREYLKYYHFSICFVNDTEHLPFDEATAKLWIEAVFGKHSSKVTDITEEMGNPIGKAKNTRHYWLIVTNFDDQRL